MPKILVLYYSSYGHIEQMAVAAAEGARTGDAVVDVKRVPETVPSEIVTKQNFCVNEAHPEASPDELEGYDAIIVGSPTNYGNMSSQMSTFWSRTTPIWKR